MEREPQVVVVGLDDSPEATDALAWARRQAGPDDRIVVARAWDVPVSLGYDFIVPVDADEVGQAVKQKLVDTVEEIGDDRLIPAVIRARPGPAIAGEAEMADVVVIGHRGDGRIRLMIGSTTNYVVHHVSCPVVVVRGRSSGPVHRVVVGVDDDLHDGTSPSVRALRWAYSVPGVEHISVVHAWEIPAIATGLYGGLPLSSDTLEQAADGVIGRAIAAAGPSPAHVEIAPRAVQGSSSRALMTASSDAELVVVGSRGRGGLADMVVGSTSVALAAHSQSPVAIVR